MFSFIMYYIYWRGKVSDCKASSGRIVKYLSLQFLALFVHFPLCLPCCCLCVRVTCFDFLEIKNIKEEYFLFVTLLYLIHTIINRKLKNLIFLRIQVIDVQQLRSTNIGLSSFYEKKFSILLNKTALKHV